MLIQELYPEEIRELMIKKGEKAFRADQIFEGLHKRGASSYDELTNLPAALREKLEADFPLVRLKLIRHLTSQVDQTQKFLFALPDGNMIESVWMRYRHGTSVCISSQAGCRMGCRFCASTLDGLARSLNAAEMLEQVYEIQRITKERVSHVVVMGSGEPLDNYEATLRFIRLISHPKGLQISQRNLTVSTCGLVPGIYRLAEEKLAMTLAISLHAATDEKRQRLMPIARKYSLEELMKACRYYRKTTGRRITFEYALVEGENDTREDAIALKKLLDRSDAHVNLIPLNRVKERKYERSGEKEILEFQKNLEKFGINVTIRREMGSDINGACGQLRKSYVRNRAGREPRHIEG